RGVAPPAEAPPPRRAERLPQEIPERDVYAADGAHRDPAPSDGGKRATLADRVVRAGAAVEQLPDAGDVARVASHEDGRELLADQRDQRRVVAEVTDGGFGFPEPHVPRVGLDLDETGVERVVPAEIADVRTIGGNLGREP